MPFLECDTVIIGAGQAAPPIIEALSGRGRKMVLVERGEFGGSCVNYGCTPTKAALASAKFAHEARRGAEFGIEVPTVRVDFPAVLASARAIVQQSVDGLGKYFTENPDLVVVREHARFAGKRGERYIVTAGDTEIIATHAIIDTGAQTAYPGIEGLPDPTVTEPAAVDSAVIDSESWLHRKRLPERLVVLGGGYIAVEMGQFYRRMGAQVTIVEHGDQILAHEDADVATAMQEFLEQEGIEFRLGNAVSAVSREGDELVLEVGRQRLRADQLFVATGRRANTHDLGLETIGIETTKLGTIPVDEHLRTAANNVFAVGDVRGGPMFTSTAWDDGRIVSGVLTGDPRRTTARTIPYAVFTDPELGRVGITEKEATEQGLKFQVLQFQMSHNGLARERRETKGFIKVLVDDPTDLILGAAVLAAEGAEMVRIFADLIEAKATRTTLVDAVMVHPSYAEAVQSAVL